MVEKLIELSKNLFCEDSKKHNNIIDEIDKIYKNMIKKDLKLAKDIATDMLHNKDSRVKYIGAAYSIRFGINKIKSKVTLLKPNQMLQSRPITTSPMTAALSAK